MKPEQYYTEDDTLSTETRNRLWRQIARSMGQRRVLFAIRDARSFFAGMAAAVILFLSGAGFLSLMNAFIDARQPQEIRFDDAYRSAIREFESLVPPATPVTLTEPAADALQSKLRQVVLIDSAIVQLRSEIARTDVSPLKRLRLRQLYNMKLQVLQDIIQLGDFEL